jgi:four helix bundle protein
MKIRTHKGIDAYKLSFDSAMEIYELSKLFPKEERYSLTDQVRRSSRSICANIAESFRARRYVKSFISKLSIAEAEAAETQVWIDFAYACGYISKETHDDLFDKYDHTIAMIVKMITNPEDWLL